MNAGRIAKCIVGGALAGLAALGTALADGGVTAPEWVGVAVAAIGTGEAVYWTRNAPAPEGD